MITVDMAVAEVEDLAVDRRDCHGNPAGEGAVVCKIAEIRVIRLAIGYPLHTCIADRQYHSDAGIPIRWRRPGRLQWLFLR